MVDPIQKGDVLLSDEAPTHKSTNVKFEANVFQDLRAFGSYYSHLQVKSLYYI